MLHLCVLCMFIKLLCEQFPIMYAFNKEYLKKEAQKPFLSDHFVMLELLPIVLVNLLLGIVIHWELPSATFEVFHCHFLISGWYWCAVLCWPVSFIVQVNIGKKWKDVIDYNDKITYTFHVCLQIRPLFAPHFTFFLNKKNTVEKISSICTEFTPTRCLTYAGWLQKREAQQRWTVHRVRCTSWRTVAWIG